MKGRLFSISHPPIAGPQNICGWPTATADGRGERWRPLPPLLSSSPPSPPPASSALLRLLPPLSPHPLCPQPPPRSPARPLSPQHRGGSWGTWGSVGDSCGPSPASACWARRATAPAVPTRAERLGTEHTQTPSHRLTRAQPEHTQTHSHRNSRAGAHTHEHTQVWGSLGWTAASASQRDAYLTPDLGTFLGRH